MVAALQSAEVDYTGKCTTDVVVGIATHYGLEGSGIESNFCAVQNSSEAHPDFSAMDTGSFLGLKRPAHCADHPLPSSTRFRMGWRYTSTSSPPPQACQGVTCTVTTDSTYLTVYSLRYRLIG